MTTLTMATTATITEIAEDVFRICNYVAPFDLQFNSFLIRDEEPLLFHAGLNMLFSENTEAVGSLIDVADLRWIGFSHYEADECGALNRWQVMAPQSEAVCSAVAKRVSVDDVALRPAFELLDGEMLVTGKHRLRFLQTPHVPHGWDAGMLFDEVTGTLLCSDVGTHHGDVGPMISSGLGERTRQGIERYVGSEMDHAHGWTNETESILRRMADLEPTTLAIMHGSSFQGDCRRALGEVSEVWWEMLGGSC